MSSSKPATAGAATPPTEEAALREAGYRCPMPGCGKPHMPALNHSPEALADREWRDMIEAARKAGDEPRRAALFRRWVETRRPDAAILATDRDYAAALDAARDSRPVGEAATLRILEAKFREDESKWAAAGSGMTKDQQTGAAMVWAWLRSPQGGLPLLQAGPAAVRPVEREGLDPTAEQQERFKFRANQRADDCEERIDGILAAHACDVCGRPITEEATPEHTRLFRVAGKLWGNFGHPDCLAPLIGPVRPVAATPDDSEGSAQPTPGEARQPR